MIMRNPQGEVPEVHKEAYVHPSAEIIGNVKIGRNVFIGPGAVIRADEPGSSVVIEENCNIQDRVVIHALSGSAVLVKKNSSLAHGCIVHGPCEIGEGCFVGFGSVVFKARLGRGVIVKHLALVEGVDVPEGRLVPSGAVVSSSAVAEDLEPAGEELVRFAHEVVEVNLELAKGYRKIGLK